MCLASINNEPAKSTAKLLGCDVEELMTALSTHNICAGNENISQNLTFSQAVNIRDTLAKALYSCLFDWLIDRINKLLEAWKCETSSTISILDICGFESFDKNSFEQLCINYANERLQQHFIRHLFKLDQETFSFCLEEDTVFSITLSECGSRVGGGLDLAECNEEVFGGARFFGARGWGGPRMHSTVAFPLWLRDALNSLCL
eukprot:Gb_31404 [translate_table: standard]